MRRRRLSATLRSMNEQIEAISNKGTLKNYLSAISLMGSAARPICLQRVFSCLVGLGEKFEFFEVPIIVGFIALPLIDLE